MVAYGTVDYTLSSSQGAARVRAAMVTEDFWDLAGARVVAGRLPRSDERDIVLLSQAFAAQWFAGRADVVDSTVALNGRQATVVGILPAHFRFQLPGFNWAGFRPADVDVYQPMGLSSERSGQIALVNVVGKLKAGTTLESARAELEVIRARIAHDASESVRRSPAAAPRAAARATDRTSPVGAGGAPWRGRVRAPHRLCQRRQPPPRPRIGQT